MAEKRIFRALGMMSGTSADGVDAAILETDGEAHVVVGPALARAYPRPLTRSLRAAMTAAQAWAVDQPKPAAIEEASQAVTRAHAEAVEALLGEAALKAGDIDVIGFHGQTVLHRPDLHRTEQIGDGALLARLTGIDVVGDFRGADVAAGGQGAPLLPLYHRARAAGLVRPVAILNIGGVANVTYVGADERLLAFDTGPGNGLLDDWMAAHTGATMDRDGALARLGRVDEALLACLLDHPYFALSPPKSLDRLDFSIASLRGLTAADGAATLAAFTAAAVQAGASFFPAPAREWLVTGGGRHNPTVMAALAARCGAPVRPVEALGWRGDVLEAEGFAYFAVRSLRGLPITLPETTGAPRPLTGGVLHRAR